jgi:NitT/TauT family transport system substrate-binding protein
VNLQDALKRALRVPVAAAAMVLAAGGLSHAQSIELVEGSSPTISMADMVIASKVFFPEEGLTATFNNATNGVVATQLVANGEGRIGNITMEAYIRGFEQGIRGKFIATRGNRNNYYMAVPADSPIQSMADLKDKKIGVLSMGAQAIFYLKSLMKLSGYDPNADYMLPVGFGDSAVAALRSDQVQALFLTEPAYASLERGGQKFRYIFHPKLKGAITAGYFTSDASVANQRETLVKFLRAMKKTEIFVNENPQAAIKLFWEQFPEAKPQGSDEEAVALGVAEMNFTPVEGDTQPVSHVARPDTSTLTVLLEEMKSDGLIKEGIKVEDLVNTDIYDEAVASIDVEAVKKIARDWGK